MKVKTYFCVNWFSTYCTDCDECKCNNPRFMNLLQWLLVEQKKIQKIASRTLRTRNKSDLGRNKFTNICFSYSSWKPAGSNTSPLKSQLVFRSYASAKVLDTVTFSNGRNIKSVCLVRISAIVIQVAKVLDTVTFSNGRTIKSVCLVRISAIVIQVAKSLEGSTGPRNVADLWTKVGHKTGQGSGPGIVAQEESQERSIFERHRRLLSGGHYCWSSFSLVPVPVSTFNLEVSHFQIRSWNWDWS